MIRVVEPSRVFEFLKERSGITELSARQQAVWKGVRVSTGGILFLLVFCQIDEDIGAPVLLLVSMLSFIYMWAYEVDLFWTAVGLGIGAFFSLFAVVPVIVTLEKILAEIGRLLAWHSQGPSFPGMGTVGWLTVMISAFGFLPYGFKITGDHLVEQRAKRILRQKEQAIRQRYQEAVSLFADNDARISARERDRIADYWYRLPQESAAEHAKIIGWPHMELIHSRVKQRVESKRYQKRHQI